MKGSTIFAGVRAGVEGLPTELSDVTPGADIASFSIAAGADALFADSRIAAAGIGDVSLRGVQPANGGTAFGVAADTIAKLTVRGNASPKVLENLSRPASRYRSVICSCGCSKRPQPPSRNEAGRDLRPVMICGPHRSSC
jgi:hypothetical protein